MLITLFYAIFGGVLFVIALLNSGFKIFGKQTNKSNTSFLIVTYLFGTLFLVAGIILTIMENRENIATTAKTANSQVLEQKIQEETPDKKQTKENEKNYPNKKLHEQIDEEQSAITSTKTNFMTTDNWAQIKSRDKFVACKNVVNRMPVGITDSFNVGDQIFVWAQIYAPRTEERVRLVWMNADGDTIASKTFTIRRNLGEGYRIYYWKYLKPGRYTVSLFNGKDEEIGRIAINVAK